MRKLWMAGVMTLALVSSAHAAEVTINQANNKFVPDAVTIKAGDTLVFKNGDALAHNITVINPFGEKSDLGMQKPNADALKQTFRDPGEYQVRCSIHPMMKLALTVI